MSIRGFPMRNFVFAGVIAGVGAFAGAVPASASVFELMFTGTEAGSPISGTLELALGSGSSPYKVIGVDAGSYVDIGGTDYTITDWRPTPAMTRRPFFPPRVQSAMSTFRAYRSRSEATTP